VFVAAWHSLIFATLSPPLPPVPDVFTKAKRSKVMAAILSTGNKATELNLAAMLRATGITGWRRRQPLPGRPDFLFRSARLAVFVDGCFWHGCPWHCRMPKSRGSYWKPKIDRNMVRDKVVGIALRKRGWRVVRIWEHSLRDPLRVVASIEANLAKTTKTRYKAPLNAETFEKLLSELCDRLTDECRSGRTYDASKPFEDRVRQLIKTLLDKFHIPVNFSPHPYAFPDIVLGKFGVEVKFTTNDTWRSVANSVFESFRSKDVKHIYVVFGKMGGQPQVRWGRYDECVMHVRTSHVPRFEVEIGTTRPLFPKLGITYDQFSALSEAERMTYIRKYARDRLKPGGGLWWLESSPDKALELQVRPFSELEEDEQLKLRAEASLLFPQIVGSSHNRTKYVAPLTFLLSYHGILAARDIFSAGSATARPGTPESKIRGGNYVRRALQVIEKHMIKAAHYLPSELFVTYWGSDIRPDRRIKEWLARADVLANVGAKPWKPSDYLFKELPEAR
jgi:DNA mismatch endonuclease Vsr